jgi:hypothetical protein
MGSNSAKIKGRFGIKNKKNGGFFYKPAVFSLRNIFFARRRTGYFSERSAQAFSP